MRLAVVGRPNVGKSSFINAILGEERVIVSDIAGTTRDAIDPPFVWQDRSLVFNDTAGVKRAGKVQGPWSTTRSAAMRAMERSDVAMYVFDGADGLTDGDKRWRVHAKMPEERVWWWSKLGPREGPLACCAT